MAVQYNIRDGYIVGNSWNHSHLNKLKILRMTMENWHHEYRIGGKATTNGVTISKDSRMDKLFEADLHKVNELTERGTKTMLEDDKEFLGTDKFLTKDEMLEMNDLFKAYGGERVTND